MKVKKLLFAVCVTASMMAAAETKFSAGFARVDITPPLETPLAGYYSYRPATGVLDPLEATCVAVADGERTALLITLDNLQIPNRILDGISAAAAKTGGVPPEAVYIAATHTHMAPTTVTDDCIDALPEPKKSEVLKLIEFSNMMLLTRVADAAKFAVADLAPAKLRLARGECKGISFIRRYRMKDGSVRTNPDRRSPEVVGPIGTPDETVQLARFVREGKPDIAIVNFQTHPDVIGGSRISADWPGSMRRTVESALNGEVRVAFFNGAQGDVNHLAYPVSCQVAAPSHYANSQRMGRKLAGVVLELWDYAEPAEVGSIGYRITKVAIPAKPFDESKLDRYRKIRELYLAHNGAELTKLCGTGMEKTSGVAEALHALSNYENHRKSFEMPVSCVTIGHALAFGGFPGEPFTDLGRSVKANSKFRMTMATCTTNGSFGYFPVASAFDEGGYEQRSSRYDKGVGELLAGGINSTLAELYAK